MPLVQTRGAASAQGFGEFAQVTAANYIEDVFSTYVYTGTGATQTITNGIDLSTKGGLVWTKARYYGISHRLVDTARGATYEMSSDTTDASSVNSTGLTSFGTTGYTIGSAGGYNNSGGTYASWTFREQPKFFDVVTYTGTGSNATIAHSLGSVPGSIIVKRTDTTAAWAVYHRSLANTEYLVLNSTAAKATGATRWNSTTPTSAVFSVGTDASVNASGGTYVAYLFAHDAGGFGLTGTDNVISCGLATVASADAVVTLGWEPQYVLYKQSDGVGAWTDVDSMRGLTVNQVANNSRVLFANNSNAEETNNGPALTATGFILPYVSGNSHGNGAYIYIAIRRGPMKVPTLGTSVFDADTLTPAANLTGTKVTNPFATDLLITTQRDHAGLPSSYAVDRLRGGSVSLATNSTGAEQSWGTPYSWTFDYNDGFLDNFAYPQGSVTTPMIYWSFKRAPGFFDEVCYTGTGSATTQTHNLGVVPELMITKSRSTVYSPAWGVYHSALGNTKYLNFLSSSADVNASYWNNTTPTGSVFTVNSNGAVNASGATYVAYLFATCAGVSKVGSYTGTGTTKQIDCGFTAGARFVLIKRTDDTGDWYVWDSARGIVSGNDSYLLLNSTAAEVTSTDYIDTYSAGFEISSTAPAAINASGGSFIFFAVA